VIPYRKFSDTLKNDNYALTPPKPPKAPKVECLDVLGAPPKAPKAPKVEATPRAMASPLDGLAALDALHPEPQKSTAAPESAQLIAPSPWFECVARPGEGEPGLEHPCPARRGRVGEEDGVFVHFCAECGRWGAYGYGVNLRAGRLGHWYCAEHRPKGTLR
jgi:hypothetical protein